MKKIKLFLKDFFSLVANVRQLENDVENLENKILAPEKVNSVWDTYANIVYSSSGWASWDKQAHREITLEEKVDAIAKALKINFEWTPEQDKTVVAKINKKK